MSLLLPQSSPKKKATYQKQNLKLSIFILSLHLYDRNIHQLESQGQHIIPRQHIISSTISNVSNKECAEKQVYRQEQPCLVSEAATPHG